MKAHGIAPIDLLVVNLYPFEADRRQAGCTLDDAIENIDIGGPAMVRAAAKNHDDRRRGRPTRDYAARARRDERRPAALTDADALRARGQGLRAHRAPTTRAISQLARRAHPASDGARSVPGAAQRPVRNAQDAALRREPAPAGGVLSSTPRPRRGVARHRPAAAGQGALATTTSPTPTRRSNASTSFDAARPASSSSTPIPAASPIGADAARGLPQGASAPTRPRPSAASSPSTARSTARRRAGDRRSSSSR